MHLKISRMSNGLSQERQEPLRNKRKMLIADYGLFVGWGPNPEPEYVAVVVLEEAGFEVRSQHR